MSTKILVKLYAKRIGQLRNNMLWRGISSKNLTKINKNKTLLINKQKYSSQFSTRFMKKSLYKINYSFSIPHNWDVIIFYKPTQSSYVLLFYNVNYYFKLSFTDRLSTFSFDLNSRVVTLHSFYMTLSTILFKNYYNKVFRIFNTPIVFKIKFKGKGYYLYKNKRNTITPQFNYAHRILIYSYFVGVKFLSKTTLLLFGYNKNVLLRAAKGIKAPRPINIFTGRGVRFARQVIYKKVGKVSSYR